MSRILFSFNKMIWQFLFFSLVLCLAILGCGNPESPNRQQAEQPAETKTPVKTTPKDAQDLKPELKSKVAETPRHIARNDSDWPDFPVPKLPESTPQTKKQPQELPPRPDVSKLVNSLRAIASGETSKSTPIDTPSDPPAHPKVANLPAGILPSGENPHNFVIHGKNGLRPLHLLPDGKVVLCQDTQNDSSAILTVDLRTNREIQNVALKGFRPVSSAVSGDGRYLVLVNKAKFVPLDLKMGRPLGTLNDESGELHPARVSNRMQLLTVAPNNRTLAVAVDRHVELWDLETRKRLNSLAEHATQVNAVAFSPDGRKLVSVGSEVIREWDVKTGNGRNLSFSDPYGQFIYQPDTSWFIGSVKHATGSYGTKLVHAESGRVLFYLKHHYAFAYSPKQKHLMSIPSIENPRTAALEIRQLPGGQSVGALPFDPRLVNEVRPFMLHAFELSLAPDERFALARFSGDRNFQIWSLSQEARASYRRMKIRSIDDRPSQTTVKKMDQDLQDLRKTTDIEKFNRCSRLIVGLCEAGKNREAQAELDHLCDVASQKLEMIGPRRQFYDTAATLYGARLKDPKKALECSEKSIQLANAQGNVAASTLINMHRQCGFLLEQLKRPKEAIEQIETALALDPELKNEALILDMSRFHQQAGNHPKAIEYARKNWELKRDNRGVLHGHTQAALDTLIRLHEQKQEWNQIAALYENQLAHLKKYKGAHHPDVAEMARRLARLYSKMGKNKLALERMDESQRVLRDFVCRQLSTMSEPEQLAFLKTQFHPAINEALSFAWRYREEPGIAEMTAGWTLNNKSVASRAMAERTRMALGSRDPKVRALADELREVRQSITRMSFNGTFGEAGTPSVATVKSRDRDLEALRDREETLSWQIGLAGWTELRRDPWVELSSVRERMPSNTVLLELALAEIPDDGAVRRSAPSGSPNWSQARFLAWVIPPAGQNKVELVDLGPASGIMQRVLVLHQGLALTGAIIGQRGEKAAAELIDNELQLLSNHLLNNLPSVVPESNHWILSPDSILWFVPWAALRQKGRYIVEDHTTSYQLSGRDLVTAHQQPAEAKPVIVANPDFDPDPPTSSPGRPFGPLPGTELEAKLIQPHLKAICSELPAIYLEKNATEQIVKSVVRPEMLVLSTHGFVMPKKNANPLAACGVALAGANGTTNQNGHSAKDDGLLTGLEIVSVDLRGTRLVTLSACQTGIGELRTGEGLASLRQAFHLAGAQAIAASLWSVPDRETAQLMATLFSRLAAGESQARAFQEAQRDVIRSLRKETGVANPFYWAAFTLTGATPKKSAIAPQPGG